MTRILIVDDEEVYCRNLRLLLERQGHEVAVAQDGETALAVGPEFAPKLLVVDWMLRNEMDGLEVANALHAILPDLLVILITGYPAEELEEQIRNGPVACVLRKPFALQELMDQIEQLVKL